MIPIVCLIMKNNAKSFELPLLAVSIAETLLRVDINDSYCLSEHETAILRRS